MYRGMDTCQHEKAVRGEHCGFSAAKGQLPDSGVAAAMSEVREADKRVVVRPKTETGLKEDTAFTMQGKKKKECVETFS